MIIELQLFFARKNSLFSDDTSKFQGIHVEKTNSVYDVTQSLTNLVIAWLRLIRMMICKMLFFSTQLDQRNRSSLSFCTDFPLTHQSHMNHAILNARSKHIVRN